MKRIGRLISVLILCTALVAGCGGKAADSGNEGGKSSDDRLKIGVSIWSTTDALGSQCKQILDAAATALDVEIEYVEQGHVSGKVAASVETLAEDGCKGIIVCNSADSEMTSIINTCNEKQVYLTQFFRIISETNSPDIYDLAEESAYFIGAVHENEVENGRKLVQILLEKGCRNIGLIGWEQGDATWLGRWEGYKSGVDEWNASHANDQATLLEPKYAGTTKEGGAKATQSLMDTYYGLDAIIPAGGGGNPLQGVMDVIKKAGMTGKISVVSTDFLPDLGERLADGSVTGESGGHFLDPLFAFIMVYDAVKAASVGYSGKFEDVEFPYLYVSSTEEYAQYEKFFLDRLPYTESEIKELATLDMDGLKSKAAAVSIEDAARRAGA